MKNKSTEEIYAVVMFTLLFGDELEQVRKELGEANLEKDSEDPTPDPSADGDDLD